MKKSILWGIIAIIFIVGGGGIYLNEQHQHSASQPAQSASSSKKIKKSSSLNSSKMMSSQLNSSSSNKAVNSNSSSSDSKSKDINDTGNAGTHGAGKMGDHTVNGKEVDQETIENVKKKLKSLGYNPASWSPQDIINLYRYASNQGHDAPAKITKDDVNGYLK